MYEIWREISQKRGVGYVLLQRATPAYNNSKTSKAYKRVTTPFWYAGFHVILSGIPYDTNNLTRYSVRCSKQYLVCVPRLQENISYAVS